MSLSFSLVSYSQNKTIGLCFMYELPRFITAISTFSEGGPSLVLPTAM
jgi:hypothetical protein